MSGHGNAPHAAERAIARFQQRGVDVSKSSAPTPNTRARLSTMPSSAAPTRWWCVGGDGIISLALQSLALGDIPLGIIPAGTGNDHAREYRIPKGDPEAAADVVADGVDRDRRPGPHRQPRRSAEVVRHRDGRRFRFTGQRPDQSHALAARPDALQPRDASPSSHSFGCCRSGSRSTTAKRSSPT